MPVLENDGPFNQFEQAARGAAGLCIGLDPHWRQADFVARLDPVLRIHALAIDAHFTLAQQPIHPAARHGLEMAHEEVIDALAGLILSHGAQSKGTFWPSRRRQAGSRTVHPISSRETLAFRPARDSDTRSLACLPRPAFLDVCQGVMCAVFGILYGCPVLDSPLFGPCACGLRRSTLRGFVAWPERSTRCSITATSCRSKCSSASGDSCRDSISGRFSKGSRAATVACICPSKRCRRSRKNTRGGVDSIKKSESPGARAAVHAGPSAGFRSRSERFAIAEDRSTSRDVGCRSGIAMVSETLNCVRVISVKTAADAGI